jgi:hypothetical protein
VYFSDVAKEKEHTALPDGVYLSSGSLPILPNKITLFTDIFISPCSSCKIGLGFLSD